MDGPSPMEVAKEPEKLKELAEDSSVAPPVAERPKPEDLVARAIAPVKDEYLRPPPVRPGSTSFLPDDGRRSKSANEDGTLITNSVLTQEKKSKRQQKRERQQEQKSAKNLCPEIARTGDVSACRYGGTCRFSHDFDGFIAQKPEDLPGTCPFFDTGNPCPYGVACRFSSTHIVCAVSKEMHVSRKNLEVNVLSKDLQKLLWKNKVKFPKADSQLKLLGLMGGKGSKRKEDAEQDEEHHASQNGSVASQEVNDSESNISSVDKIQYTLNACSKDDHSNDESVVDDMKPHKKPKIPTEHFQSSLMNGELNEDHVRTVIEEDAPNNSCSSRIEIIQNINVSEKKLIDFRDKLYLAPLTTVGNLPFRRVCKELGADITCGEMAMCTNLLQGQASEWALLRRHSSEDVFGVQICGAYPDTIAKTVELIERECCVDFIDINMGCPIDIVCNKGAGSSLLTKPARMKGVIQAASSTIDKPLTVKVRTGYFEGRNRVDSIIGDIGHWGVSALTIHGRSRQQRYSKLADWDYIYQCAGKSADNLQVLGNGDIFSYEDWNRHRSDCPRLSTCMIARGALIKPWLFTEIKEQRHWDISSAERFDILKKFVHLGLEHWGSDSKGVETTRHFLLEWLSYTYRYIPVGVLDIIPQRLNWRPPSYFGRNDLETLMASDSAADWIRISEMLLGKVPDGFTFAPKHKSNAYDRAENG